MSKSSELVQGMFINAGNVEWVKMELAFKVDQLAEMLITHKDVFEASKGYGNNDNLNKKLGSKINVTLFFYNIFFYQKFLIHL